MDCPLSEWRRRHWLLAVGACAMAPRLRAGTAGPYGPLGDPDANGVRLPTGFTARLLATSGQAVGATALTWHVWPDGGACFPASGGGWIYVSNCELGPVGTNALRFAPDGSIAAAYTVLDGLAGSCAGGGTPWGTWLACQEVPRGQVFECDPQQPGQGLARPALGRFAHEAAAVDPATGWVYLTEDDGPESRLYRFRPRRRGNLGSGTLEAAWVAPNGSVSWTKVSPLKPYRGSDSTAFARPEGAFHDRGTLYFSTTADDRVWALDTAANTIRVVYDAAVYGAGAPLHQPDTLTVHAPSGDVLVGEDEGALQIVLLAATSGGQREPSPFMQLVGHAGSEVTGLAFSPDGRRLYFSSQRGTGGAGMSFEVTGPFRGA